MGLDSIGFGGLLRCWIAGLLLALALDHLRKLELRQPLSVLALALLPALLWLPAMLPHLAQQCQAILLATIPGQFIEHTFNLPLS